MQSPAPLQALRVIYSESAVLRYPVFTSRYSYLPPCFLLQVFGLSRLSPLLHLLGALWSMVAARARLVAMASTGGGSGSLPVLAAVALLLTAASLQLGSCERESSSLSLSVRVLRLA